jgi:hypothetical protein
MGLVAGCSKGGLKTAQLSGTVTFKGKPVPAGYIQFQGSLGEVRVVQIKDGVYDSAQEKAPGIFAGPTAIRIAGFDGKKVKGFSQGKQIFNPYELKDEIPVGTSTKDFTVPASAADNLKIVPTSDEP